MSGEEWRRVPSLPDYEVSDQARVRSWHYYNQPVVPHLMTPTLSKNGYYYVRVTGPDGKRRNPTLHKLIAEAFLGVRPEGQVVRHLDGVPTNNSLSNLRYGSPSENQDDAVRHGVHFCAGLIACKSGHPFTPDNTRIERRPNGRSARRCRTCQREYESKRRAA